MIKRKLTAISLALALVTGTANMAPAAEQLDNGVWVDGFRVGNSRTGRMALYFFARDNNGKVEVCGNYYLWGGASVHRILRRALNRYRFFYDGKTLFTDASFLWEAPSEEQLGSQVLCKLTDIPYTENANNLIQGRMPFAR